MILKTVETVLVTELLLVFALVGPVTATDPASSRTALTGAVVHTVSGATVDNVTLLIRDNRVEAVGPDIEIPEGCRIIRLDPGSEIYPAMIDADSNMGRIESELSVTIWLLRPRAGHYLPHGACSWRIRNGISVLS